MEDRKSREMEPPPAIVAFFRAMLARRSNEKTIAFSQLWFGKTRASPEDIRAPASPLNICRAYNQKSRARDWWSMAPWRWERPTPWAGCTPVRSTTIQLPQRHEREEDGQRILRPGEPTRLPGSDPRPRERTRSSSLPSIGEKEIYRRRCYRRHTSIPETHLLRQRPLE
jgi:hypothetical protein